METWAAFFTDERGVVRLCVSAKLQVVEGVVLNAGHLIC